MAELLILGNNVDASAGRSVTDNLPGFKNEHTHFAFIATSKEKASFFVECYTARTSAAVGPSADDCAALNLASVEDPSFREVNMGPGDEPFEMLQKLATFGELLPPRVYTEVRLD